MGTEEELLLMADGGRDLLDRDNIPNENQSLTCFSCDATMKGLYCHECGNKNDNYRRSVFSLGIELFQNLTAVDSRVWRSLTSLILKPGRMAREFADGARQRWTSPVRFYIAASLMLFGYIAATQTQIIAVGSIGESQASSIIKIGQVGNSESNLSPRLLFFVQKSRMIDLADNEETARYGDEFLDNITGIATDQETLDGLNEVIADLDNQISAANNAPERIALEQTRNQLALQATRIQEALEKQDDSEDNNDNANENNQPPEDASTDGGGLTFSGPNGQEVTLDRDGMSQLMNMVLQRPELVNNQVNDHLKLAMFFMMPFAMLQGAVFIRGRKKAMLYDHLVHAAYIHAFSFLLLLVFIILHQYTPVKGLLLPYTLILLIYLPLSAKGMFERSWFKSVLTAYGVGVIYSFIMLILFVVIVAFALQTLAVDVSAQRALVAS